MNFFTNSLLRKITTINHQICSCNKPSSITQKECNRMCHIKWLAKTKWLLLFDIGFSIDTRINSFFNNLGFYIRRHNRIESDSSISQFKRKDTRCRLESSL